MKFRFTLIQVLFLMSGLSLMTSSLSAQSRKQMLEQKIERDRIKAEQEWAEAYEKAARLGWKTEGYEADGTFWQLMALDSEGDPIYYKTMNFDAAKSIRVDKVWPLGGAGLNLNGQFVDVGIWDGGSVRTTHDVFGGRVIQYDNTAGTSGCMNTTAPSNHATHVAGTLLGNTGMAFNATGRAYDWCSDFQEMRMDAKLENYPTRLSNHSYGPIDGWEKKDGRWTWYGNTDCGEDGDGICAVDEAFGQYSSWSAGLDDIAYDHENYLILFAAGNDRGQTPSFGEQWQVDGNTDPFQVYIYLGLGEDPEPDGGDAGFDCLGASATTKNILTVGAVEDVPNYTGPSSVVMSSFSSWGPTDDGRIKPDIVANGVGVTSAWASADDAYETRGGTSMATPSVTGACALLQQHHWLLHDQTYMSASQLKGLVIHTADEAGTTGPDFKFGWGLMNTERAANLITEDKDVDGFLIQYDSMLNNNNYVIEIFSTGEAPLKATLVWLDPAGTANDTDWNNTTPQLVNDLDLRLVTPSGTTRFPYVKAFGTDAQNNQAAGTGDNVRDNVEQIYIPNPEPGIYTLSISHKGTLEENNSGIRRQTYALIMSNIIEVDENFTRNDYCSEAEFINCITPRTGNTQLSTAVFPTGHQECGLGQERGVWFTFNGSGQPMTVTTDFPETLFDTQITVYEAGTVDPCISMTCIGTNDDIAFPSNPRSRLTVNTTVGKTYLVYLDGYQGATGEFKIGIEECPIPANDHCPNATYIECNSSVLGSSDFATEFEYVDQDCSADNGIEGVWFKFFGTGEEVTVSTNNPGTDPDYHITLCVYSGSCANFTYEAGGNLTNPRPSVTLSTVAGTEYFIFMGGLCIGFCGDTGPPPSAYPTGNYEIALSCPVNNDFCGDAVDVSCNEIIHGSTSGASGDDAVDLVSCDPDVDFVGGKGVWFRFEGTGDRLYASTNNNASAINSFNPEIAVFTGECGELTCINASDNTGASSNAFTSQITEVGTTYYIYLDGEGSQSGQYEIAFGCETPNANCSTAHELSCSAEMEGNTEFTSLNFSNAPDCGLGAFQPGVWFTMQGTGDYYKVSTDHPETNFDTRLRVLSGSCDGPWTCVGSNDDISYPVNTRSEVAFYSDPALTYYIYMDGWSGARGAYKINLSCIPENDICASASPITCGETLTGSTIYATGTGSNEQTNCAPNETELGTGVWYYFVGTGEPVIFSTDHAGTNFDTELMLYETTSGCSNLVCLDGNDDVDGFNANYNSSISLISEVGKTYYLYLDGHHTAKGNYELTATCNGTIDLEVFYRIDMSNETVSANGVHVAGDFQQAAGFPTNWDPAATRIYDGDSDGVYEGRVLVKGVTPGVPLMHKFINGNDWSTSEGIAPECGMLEGCCYNRFLIAPTAGAASVTTDSPCYNACLACSALPLELITFNGEIEEKFNHLFWETANEIGIKDFHLERSEDGRHFETLTKVPAQLENTENYYEWTDTEPLLKSWYRLKIVGEDGQREFSDVIYLERKVEDMTTEIKVYPMPTDGQLFVAFEAAKSEELQLLLYAVTGQLVRTLTFESEEGMNKQELDLSDLPSGMYMLNVVFENGEVVMKKVVVDKK